MMDTKNIIERCEKFGIEWDINKRWENGIDHHPEAEAIYKIISCADLHLADDYFCWKCGGDGDNGETLMYSLSVLLELLDKENPGRSHFSWK